MSVAASGIVAAVVFSAYVIVVLGCAFLSLVRILRARRAQRRRMHTFWLAALIVAPATAHAWPWSAAKPPVVAAPIPWPDAFLASIERPPPRPFDVTTLAGPNETLRGVTGTLSVGTTVSVGTWASPCTTMMLPVMSVSGGQHGASTP